jgi:P4 family phage/plasmid primase-like protien
VSDDPGGTIRRNPVTGRFELVSNTNGEGPPEGGPGEHPPAEEVPVDDSNPPGGDRPGPPPDERTLALRAELEAEVERQHERVDTAYRELNREARRLRHAGCSNTDALRQLAEFAAAQCPMPHLMPPDWNYELKVREVWGDLRAAERQQHEAQQQERREARRLADQRRSQATDGSQFFGRDGLLVQTLAERVREEVKLGRLVIHRDTDENDVLWHCRDGLWRPGAVKEVERVCGDLLGERLRHSHVSNVLLALRTGDLPVIPDTPPHPGFLHLRNGFLDWASGEFYEHPLYQDPAMLSTVQLGVEWDPSATCPTYDAWVEQVVPGLGDYLDEVSGYLMLNGNPLHKAVLLRGSGRNGKGTYLRIHTALLGDDNCASVPLQTMGENRFAVAQLHMKLANVAGDLSNEHVQKTNVFKMVTGQDSLYAERKMGQPFRFVAWAVPVFSANAVPTTSDTSVGYLSRWEVIPFDLDLTALPGGPDDRYERQVIEHELPGVAVRAVRGLQRLMARGHFERPARVQEAFREFEHRLDQVRAWLEERCDRSDETAWTYRTDLHTDYVVWAAANQHRPLSAGTFYERLEQAGVRARRGPEPARARGFGGVRLQTPTLGLPGQSPATFSAEL